MDAPLYLALDQGGHASRAVVFDAAGAPQAAASVAIATRQPQPEWVEHDALELRDSLRQCIDQVVRQLGPRAPQLRAAGLACQRASVVAWDRHDGHALTPVLSWQDTRAQAEFAAAGWHGSGQAAQFAAITGLRPSPHFGASKLAWLQGHAPAVAAAAVADRLAWGPLASYLIAGLTAEAAYRCPASIAQRTGLLEIARGAWSPALCARSGLTLASLPPVVADLSDHGSLCIGATALPLRLVAGDQNLLPAALGALAPGQVAINAGTGAFLFAGLPTGAVAAPGLLRSLLPGQAWPPAQAQEGTVNGAGAAFEWLRRRYGLEALPWAALDGDDADSDPHFLDSVGGLGSPLWRSGVPPVFSHEPADLPAAMRAVAAAVGGLLHCNLRALGERAEAPQRIVIGGGLSRSDGFCQRLADLSGLPVRRCADRELSLRGVWRLLAAADPSAADLPAAEQAERSFGPGLQAESRQRRHADWRAWLNAQLAALDQTQGAAGESR